MIPVLNGMPYLPHTLASIEKQSFASWQVVVWDNGSTDGTVEELRRWIPDRLPGRVVADRPLPLGLARRVMIEECDSTFGALLDSDDISQPDRLEKQIAFLEANPDVTVVGAQLRKIDTLGTDLGLLCDYPLRHDQIVQQMLVSNPIGQPSVTFRCAAIVAAGNYRDVKVEDYDLWLRVAAAGGRLANLPEALVNYRIHPQSTTQRQIALKQLDGFTLEHLRAAAPSLYGCSAETIEQLRRREHCNAIEPLRKIAERLGPGTWKSDVFYESARSMINSRDFRSRLAAASLHGGLSCAAAEGLRFARDVARACRKRLAGR
jgi:glycosyltransferase involved in cell wall biosynthesis